MQRRDTENNHYGVDSTVVLPSCLSERSCGIIRALARNSDGSSQLISVAVGMQMGSSKVPHVVRLSVLPCLLCAGEILYCLDPPGVVA